MTLNANKVGNAGPKQEPFEPGTYPARVVQIIDLGLQPQRPFQGQEKQPANEIMVTYEFVDEFMKDDNGEDIEDKPRWLSETFPLFSLSSDRAKSTTRYTALDPKLEYNGDWSKLLDTPVNVTVVNKPSKDGKKVYSNITSISSVRARDALKFPALVNDAKFFSLDEPVIEIFLTLPDWLQKKIKEGLEFEGSVLDALLKKHGGKAAIKDKKKEEPEDDVPEDEENEENW